MKSNIHHEMCDKQYTCLNNICQQYFVNVCSKMFYKHLIETAFHTHHLKKFLNVFYQMISQHSITNILCAHIFRILSKCNICKQRWG